MSVLRKIFRSNFTIRLLSWEYWPFGILQFPVMIYYLWLSLKARSLTFFSATNPGIPMGGMFGESKFEVIRKIPDQYLPKTILVNLPASPDSILDEMRKAGLQFPVIFKPDLGERGFMVRKITEESQIDAYLTEVRTDFIIQEFVDLPMEFGIFYTRFPAQKSGSVTSVVMKEMLAVDGDGRSTLMELIFNKDRAKLQWDKLKLSLRAQLDRVPFQGERVELVGIGNHSMGTTFLDGSHLITPLLSQSFDTIAKQIEGFYFGRFDLRCASLADLTNGRVKIMELNGCGAEPAHIYQPGFSIFKAIQILIIHWRNIYLIARQNREIGHAFITFAQARAFYKKFKAATR